MKTDDKNSKESLEKRQYKKKYIVRRHQEKEAEEEIKHYEEPQCPQYDKDEESE